LFNILLLLLLLLEVNGKVQSLEEIESRLRMSSNQQNGYSPPQNNIQFHEDMKHKKLQSMKARDSNLVCIDSENIILYLFILDIYFRFLKMNTKTLKTIPYYKYVIEFVYNSK